MLKENKQKGWREPSVCDAGERCKKKWGKETQSVTEFYECFKDSALWL